MKASKSTLLFAAALALGGATMAAACSTDEPIETVYGPPPAYDVDDPAVDVYGPPEYFDDQGQADWQADPIDVDDPAITVYGPPEAFEDTATQLD